MLLENDKYIRQSLKYQSSMESYEKSTRDGS